MKTPMKRMRHKQAARMWFSLLVIVLVSVGLTARSISLALADWSPESNYIDADLIRVGISDDAMTAQEYPLTQISATGPFTIQDKATGMLLYNGSAGEVVTISVDHAGFYLKGKNGMLTAKGPAVAVPVPDLHVLAVPSSVSPAAIMPVPGPLVVAPANNADRLKVMNITRRKEIPEFRGTFEVVRASSSPNKLSVVNVVSLEDYLKAVVPNELPMRYGVEAVKAQAVAARNYAVRPREKPWKTFDICDSQLCQVYLGSQTETPDSNRAIADTEGLVGLYNGDPILALFSSSHGGYAEDYSNAFSDPITKQYPAPPIAYLSGGPDVPLGTDLDLHTEAGARKFWTNPNVRSYDVDSPYYRWTKHWTRPELEADITKGLQQVSKDTSTRDFVSPWLKPGQSIGTLKAIKVLERGNSGKAMIVAIEGSKGTWRIEKEFLIRKVFNKGGKMLPSGNVVFTTTKSAKGQLWGITANGGGFGHGVGLSQLGASWMSKHGYPFPQIIQHYYRGVSLGSLPIAVGGAVSENRPVMTRFDVSHTQGMLWVQDGDSAADVPGKQTAIELKLNGKTLKVQPHGFRSGMDVGDYLKSGALNTLVLFPDTKLPGRKLKAWIELYPAKATPIASQ
jgi:SpoIID/LytB domain protein